VRKEADAKRLQAEFGDFFSPLVFDVTDEPAVHAAAAEVKSRMKGHTLLGLVNNAGRQQFLLRFFTSRFKFNVLCMHATSPLSAVLR
jgi:NAD(P)-dependent dehydrogenase (short-subunit alcohol dehydrogenase family)